MENFKLFFINFDEFYVVGSMIWGGHLIDAYKPVPLLETIHAYAHSWTFMPWAYPSQFNLLLVPLPLMPRWASYILFVAAGWHCIALSFKSCAGIQPSFPGWR